MFAPFMPENQMFGDTFSRRSLFFFPTNFKTFPPALNTAGKLYFQLVVYLNMTTVISKHFGTSIFMESFA